MWEDVTNYVTGFGAFGIINLTVMCVVIPLILMTKRDATSATAWILIVLLVPLLGAFLFYVFGYNHVHRPLQRKRRHRQKYRAATPDNVAVAPTEPTWNNLGELALKANAFPLTTGNQVALYSDTALAFASVLDAVRTAKHHIHIQFFIFRSDGTGRQLMELLMAKAKAGVQVRILVDGVGTGRIRRDMRHALLASGCNLSVFLPLNPLLLRIRVNLRNHRKIVVVDGTIGFTGGMNIGDEYLGKDPAFGFWRDTFFRVVGPAVFGLQQTFTEDWDFAAGESLRGPTYFPVIEPRGTQLVQVAASGPDQDTNTIRDLFFAAILSAQRRIWIASPYFVPDSGLLDALRLARLRGVEIRLLSLLHGDHYISFYAGRYFWADLLAMGGEVYQYRKGMMHSKIILIDDDLALIGSANFDNRSLHLNFEASCLFYSPDLIKEVEKALECDWKDAILLDVPAYRQRSFFSRLAENACRLFAPTL